MTILVTGAAGFIGFHVSHFLMSRGERVVGIDNLNDYYDPSLKHARLAELRARHDNLFTFVESDFGDEDRLKEALAEVEFDRIVHLGAQAGVRYSLINPGAYVRSNLAGQVNMLELARHRGVKHMVYASSSSVYGGNDTLPFRVEERVDRPISLYAATKKSCELMSESYSHLFRTPLTGLRFFTVYGPWGRPDMAMWLFAKAMMEDRPIQLFNGGDMRRDFTYIDDIVAGIIACLDHPPADNGEEKPGGSRSPHAIYNIGNHRSEELMRVVALLEQSLGKSAKIETLPMQAGDVTETYADISAIQRDLGFEPRTTIDEGVPRFVEWFRAYHGTD